VPESSVRSTRPCCTRPATPVTLIARGERLAELRREGVRLATPDTRFPSGRSGVTVAGGEEVDAADIVLVAVGVRAMPAAIAQAAAMNPQVIIPFGHHDGPLVPDGRAVLAFPGIGGGRRTDGTVDWLPVRQQRTTVDARAPHSRQVRELLATTGLPVGVEKYMQDWLDTHSILVSMLAAAVIHADLDAVAAGSDPALMRRFAVATRAGLSAFRRRGGRVRTTAIDLMYRRFPPAVAARYTGHLLRSPVGSYTVAPHCRAARHTEIPLILARARELCGPDPLVGEFLAVS